MSLAAVVRLATAAAAVAALGSLSTRPAGAAPPRRVIVAELFTSEGCSSCPPADRLLQTIVATQPLDGVEVVGLEEHITYFDQLGWRDPFSSELLTRRQSQYAAAVFHYDEIYTPQLVVNGERQCIGSDAAAVRRALADTRPSGVDVLLTIEGGGHGRLRGRIAVDAVRGALRGAADVTVAIVEDDLTTRVRGGENDGRVLPHAGVVRSMTVVGRMEHEVQTATVPIDLPIAGGVQAAHLRAIAFVQERGSRRIVGAAVARVPLG